MLERSAARVARALEIMARESERLDLALAGYANGLPAGQGDGGEAGAPSPQLVGADVLVWDEFDSHKE